MGGIGVVRFSLLTLLVVTPFGRIVGRSRAASSPGTGSAGTAHGVGAERADVMVPRVGPAHCPFAVHDPCTGDCRLCASYRLYPGQPGRMVA